MKWIMNYHLFELSVKRQFFFAFIYMQLFYIFYVCKRMMGTDYSPQSTAQSSKAIKLIIVFTQSTDETIFN